MVEARTQSLSEERLSEERRQQLFPKLTPAQIGRLSAHGRTRALQRGEVVIEQGDPLPFLVILSGAMEILRPNPTGEDLITVHEPRGFLGDVHLLSGRPSLVRARMREAGEVLEIERSVLQGLIQTDSELGDVLMRAFILRRVELIAQGLGDAVLLGCPNSAGTQRIKEFLTRNGNPYSYVDLDQEASVQETLDHFHVAPQDIPVLICRGRTALRNPTNREIADCLGFNEGIDKGQVRDVVVVGAGPSGLASSVYAASEGLNVLVLEANAPGGQAGSSSKIENYLGFPTGISGQELAARAINQAQKFGTKMFVAYGATRLLCDAKPYAVEIEGGGLFRGRAIVIATGAQYRKLPLKNLAEFEGTGVHYGATFIEAQLCGDQEVAVVGGGNSAGQAAVFLSQTCTHVHVLIRSGSLAESMSNYLIRRIQESPAITLHPHTEIVALDGDGHLERVQWRDNRNGNVETRPIQHVFLMTGASPNTQWLKGCLALDEKGFIKTGQDLSAEDLAWARWPLSRKPYLLETSLPRVFAVGDVRSGNVKRVASAVGEGAISIHLVHKVLQE